MIFASYSYKMLVRYWMKTLLIQLDGYDAPFGGETLFFVGIYLYMDWVSIVWHWPGHRQCSFHFLLLSYCFVYVWMVKSIFDKSTQHFCVPCFLPACTHLHSHNCDDFLFLCSPHLQMDGPEITSQERVGCGDLYRQFQCMRGWGRHIMSLRLSLSHTMRFYSEI